MLPVKNRIELGPLRLAGVTRPFQLLKSVVTSTWDANMSNHTFEFAEFSFNDSSKSLYSIIFLKIAAETFAVGGLHYKMDLRLGCSAAKVYIILEAKISN